MGLSRNPARTVGERSASRHRRNTLPMKFNVTAMHEHNLQSSYHMMEYGTLSYWIILENSEVLVRLALFFRAVRPHSRLKYNSVFGVILSQLHIYNYSVSRRRAKNIQL
jgi:hypothetical protein